MYTKVVKYISWALLIIGALIGILGFIIGFGTNNAVAVDILLYCGYAMAGIAVAAIVLLGIYASAIVDPKKLLKSALILVAALVIIVVAYLVAPGADPVGYSGLPQSKTVLKLTDTILILTYVFCGATILSVVVGSIISSIRNKK